VSIAPSKQSLFNWVTKTATKQTNERENLYPHMVNVIIDLPV